MIECVPMSSMIARLYLRKFNSELCVKRMLATTKNNVIGRISAVSATLDCYVPSNHPNIIIEFWQYPDTSSMEWVQQSLKAVAVIPDKMLPENDIHTLDCVFASGADWED